MSVFNEVLDAARTLTPTDRMRLVAVLWDEIPPGEWPQPTRNGSPSVDVGPMISITVAHRRHPGPRCGTAFESGWGWMNNLLIHDGAEADYEVSLRWYAERSVQAA